ncbi:hypothetical protein ABZV58_23145 [Nocardia sp. NPDC004654]|uniref:hypothetical protein n=1 Tax=Nocardia sp. NPDC004654 TaxID=3154776 RepID=UPI0033AA8FE5
MSKKWRAMAAALAIVPTIAFSSGVAVAADPTPPPVTEQQHDALFLGTFNFLALPLCVPAFFVPPIPFVGLACVA